MIRAFLGCTMIIRKTEPKDLERVMQIYDIGRQYMRLNGNKDQWTNGYPQKELIQKDIEKSQSYVAENEGGIPVCVFAFIEGPDPTYSVVYDGQWKDDKPYYVIHRIAVAENRKGIASFVYDWALSQAAEIRIDTHRDNIPMQNALRKNGFDYCGIVHLLNGDERLAFQKNRNTEA